MTKFKLIGATLLAAVLISVSPVEAAIINQPNDRKFTGEFPADSATSIDQSRDNVGVQEMAAKKKKKKKTKAS
jgi:hypothetical protein